MTRSMLLGGGALLLLSAAASARPAAASDDSKPISAEAAAKVNAGWALYDAGKKGKLTALEFGRWIIAAKAQDAAPPAARAKAMLPAVTILNETASDFTRADTDKDRMISPAELAIYLSA